MMEDTILFCDYHWKKPALRSVLFNVVNYKGLYLSQSLMKSVTSAKSETML